MTKRRRWPEEAESRRIEAVSLFASITELSDSVIDALESGELHDAAKRLGRLKAKASKGFYLLHNMPAMWAYDNEIDAGN